MSPNFAPTQSSEPPIAVSDAQARVLAAVEVLGTEAVAIRDANGRVLREDVIAGWDVPAADNSAMDGYAVRSADLSGASGESPVRLRVVYDLPAGTVCPSSVGPGDAIRIMTGAPIPAGADAVAQVEATDGGRDEVAVFRAVKAGANVRRQAEDIRAGDVVLGAGHVIRAGEIGALVTAGRREVRVARRPTVAILSTGSEIVDPGVRPGPGKVTNSNAWALAALVEECGAEPVVLEAVPDTKDRTVAALAAALDCDVVLTSGGVSVGAYDYVRDAVAELGAETRFWRVAMKPGKPILFAVLGRKMIFGLPGNPVSSMVGFHLFVAPAIRKAMGRVTGLLPAAIRATAAGVLAATGDRSTYLRCRVRADDGRISAVPMKLQGSGVTTSMIGANGLAIVPEGTTRIDEGSMVDVLLIGPIESS
jgi:molybdopterin molybdotransferase